MQAVEDNGLRRFPEVFESNRMGELLEEEGVKEVAVFNLRKGMTVSVKGFDYKVIATRSNGKITMRRRS